MAILFLSQLFAYLLYFDPGREWLWAWALTVGRFTSPILDVYDQFAPANPMLSVLILGLLSCFPFWAWLKRSWLYTAVSCHVSLGICMIGLTAAVDRGWYSEDIPERFATFNPATFDFSEGLVAFTAVALIILCGSSHVFFFRHVSTSASS
jgi:hypothetical protein